MHPSPGFWGAAKKIHMAPTLSQTPPVPPQQQTSLTHLQDKLVRLAQLAAVALVAVEALHLLGVRREEQQLLEVRGFQAVALHAQEDLAQLDVGELEVRNQDGWPEEEKASAGRLDVPCQSGFGFGPGAARITWMP